MGINIVVLGGTGVGKDYLVNKVIERYNLNKVITSTTRPIREGEIDGVTYHFLTEEEFMNKLKNKEFIETKKYNTVKGVWYYGTSKKDICDKNTIIILDKEGFLKYKKYVPDCISIYVENIDQTDRFFKALKRMKHITMEDVDEVYRRIKTDEEKFLNINNIVDFVVPQTYNETTLELVYSIFDRLGIGKREA